MTFSSSEWNRAFEANTHISVWPWSDLVSSVNRLAKAEDGYAKVIELGCGVGANVPFFLQSGFDYCAIEGSWAAVARLHEAYPQLSEKVVVGDFTRSIPFAGPFDLVIDRGAVTCNTTDAIRRTLKMAYDRVRHGGKFLGFDWPSCAHQDANLGEMVDPHTRTNLPSPSLADIGTIHFSDQVHLVDLFEGAGFRIDRLVHKVREITFPEAGGKLAWWHVVATKP
jgi:SAM-dependent methyltransferase